jgi:hypothetical protein
MFTRIVESNNLITFQMILLPFSWLALAGQSVYKPPRVAQTLQTTWNFSSAIQSIWLTILVAIWKVLILWKTSVAVIIRL